MNTMDRPSSAPADLVSPAAPSPRRPDGPARGEEVSQDQASWGGAFILGATARAEEAARDQALIGHLAARIATLETALSTARAAHKEILAQDAALRVDLAPLYAVAAERRQIETVQSAYGLALQRASQIRLRTRIRRWLRRRQARQIIASSPLFNPAWYFMEYPEIAARGIDPARHYLEEGAFEGRDPGPDFSTMFYFLENLDVIASGWNPLEHYERFGRRENRPTTPRTRLADLPGSALPAAEPAAAKTAPRILILSGEADTPGHTYRAQRLAAAARALGAVVSLHVPAEAETLVEMMRFVDLLIIWRLEWTAKLADVLADARTRGVPIIFDVDDLMFDPDVVDPKIIDAIRSNDLDVETVRGHYERVQKVLHTADFASAPTHFLAEQIHRWPIPAFVLPNGFDDDNWAIARHAVRARALAPGDGLVRLGYASGSRTHQRDFAVVAGAVGRILAERPECRLVLFRRGPWPTLDIEEFPVLAGLEDQIEWRDMVPVAELPRELARFDVNLAPLELDNPFCAAKSELKFFEAALAGVPSVCTPTDTFRRAVRDAETGFLAVSEEGWYRALIHLIDDDALRRRVAQAAYLDCLWTYGPERRIELVGTFLDQVLHRGRRAARSFALDRALEEFRPRRLPEIAESETVFYHDAMGQAAVTVVVPLYNYAHHIIETLESVKAQTLQALDLVVVDDRSTDDGLAVAERWLGENRTRFGRALLLRNRRNVGLGPTRNVGFAATETRYVMPFDADNVMLAPCLERCLAALEESGAAFAYPMLQQFGTSDLIFCDMPYDPIRLRPGNYIDATALIRLAAWTAVGGYGDFRTGWEDFDFWCRMAENGLFGVHVGEVLARYRVHENSMLHTVTDRAENRKKLITRMRALHPWVLEGREAD